MLKMDLSGQDINELKMHYRRQLRQIIFRECLLFLDKNFIPSHSLSKSAKIEI
jgi:hypothetical protein